MQGFPHGKGTIIHTDSRYEGGFSCGWRHGSGVLKLNSGVTCYGQEWGTSELPYGNVTIKYIDGIERKGNVNFTTKDYKQFLHPDIEKYIKDKICTNNLPRIPQRYGSYSSLYCESCWINCLKSSQMDLRWNMSGTTCQCKICPK
jgi:hypothetical protein